MRNYRYTAYNKLNHLTAGKILAASSSQAITYLENSGYSRVELSGSEDVTPTIIDVPGYSSYKKAIDFHSWGRGFFFGMLAMAILFKLFH